MIPKNKTASHTSELQYGWTESYGQIRKNANEKKKTKKARQTRS